MIIGIDLGTTNSIIAVMLGAKPVIIPNFEKETITPSIVAFDVQTHKFRVGMPAKRQSAINPENSVPSVKRVIGRKFIDNIVQDYISWTLCKVINSPNNDYEIVIAGNKYNPEEIVAMILRKLKADAEAYLGERITGAVIAIPAYFNGNQRRAIKESAELAELKLVRFISETAAASIAYWMDKKEEETVALYRLGAGSFDVSIIDTDEIGAFIVRSINGDTSLGGNDFDRRIIKWINDEFKKQHETELCNNKIMLQLLWQVAERAKCELSSCNETDINIPFIPHDIGEIRYFNITLTRNKLEELTSDLVTKTLSLCKQAITDAEEILKKNNIKLKIGRVIMVGGQTKMPLIQNKVKQFFEVPILVASSESIAIGAAIQASILAGQIKDTLLLDAIPLTIGFETVDGIMTPVIPRNTTIPTSASRFFTTSSDNQTNIEVYVFEGENNLSAENESIGKVIFQGVPVALKGVSQIEVSFDIDANGLLSVTAKDCKTDKYLNGSGYFMV